MLIILKPFETIESAAHASPTGDIASIALTLVLAIDEHVGSTVERTGGASQR